MKEMSHGFCERCEAVTEVTYDEPQLRKWARVYMMLGIPYIPLSPIIGSDWAVMLPLTMLYLLGFGPALGILREPPKCDDCGAAVSLASAPELAANDSQTISSQTLSQELAA